MKQRIVQVLGNSYAAKLVSVQNQTDYMNIYGVCRKAGIGEETRGDQYFCCQQPFYQSAISTMR